MLYVLISQSNEGDELQELIRVHQWIQSKMQTCNNNEQMEKYKQDLETFKLKIHQLLESPATVTIEAAAIGSEVAESSANINPSPPVYDYEITNDKSINYSSQTRGRKRKRCEEKDDLLLSPQKKQKIINEKIVFDAKRAAATQNMKNNKFNEETNKLIGVPMNKLLNQMNKSDEMLMNKINEWQSNTQQTQKTQLLIVEKLGEISETLKSIKNVSEFGSNRGTSNGSHHSSFHSGYGSNFGGEKYDLGHTNNVVHEDEIFPPPPINNDEKF